MKSSDDIWNEVIHKVCSIDFPTENQVLNEAFLVFQYYSELESGGHEALLNWWSEYISEVGITAYIKELTKVLEKIAAQEYAVILQKYGEEMWKNFVALENGEIDEYSFYQVVEKADREYYKLEDKFQHLLESYFVSIHTDIIE
ncbi:DMP19 family protein [Fredinandcohnia sp. FSL W7-1320]|uniref:DMP19 family protein n=1 Tax=Fredinandcohnia sp. FSL W7-1320 TaxID=2954540 RepID=UPI0030FDB477